MDSPAPRSAGVWSGGYPPFRLADVRLLPARPSGRQIAALSERHVRLPRLDAQVDQERAARRGYPCRHRRHQHRGRKRRVRRGQGVLRRAALSARPVHAAAERRRARTWLRPARPDARRRTGSGWAHGRRPERGVLRYPHALLRSSPTRQRAATTPRSCDCPNAPTPAKSSSHSPAAWSHPNSATCDPSPSQEHNPHRRRESHEHLPQQTPQDRARHLPRLRPRRALPRMAQNGLTWRVLVPIRCRTLQQSQVPASASGHPSTTHADLATGLADLDTKDLTELRDLAPRGQAHLAPAKRGRGPMPRQAQASSVADTRAFRNHLQYHACHRPDKPGSRATGAALGTSLMTTFQRWCVRNQCDEPGGPSRRKSPGLTGPTTFQRGSASTASIVQRIEALSSRIPRARLTRTYGGPTLVLPSSTYPRHQPKQQQTQAA
jgi:hypothetical protein